MKAMKVYYTEEPKEPKYVKICNNLLIPQIPAYPLLKPSYNWTRNDPKFCSNYVGNDLVTNLIDGKLKNYIIKTIVCKFILKLNKRKPIHILDIPRTSYELGDI